MMRFTFYFALALCFCAPVFARDAEGKLSGVLTPNEGQPASIKPASSFTISLDFEVDPKKVLVDIMGGGVINTCEIGEYRPNAASGENTLSVYAHANVLPGLYALRLRYAEQTIEIPRAVYVIDPEKTHFILACLGNINASENFSQIIQAVNDSDADGVVVLGNLTKNGSAEEYQSLLQALAQCTKPTWLTPGTNDNSAGHFKGYFWTSTYLTRIGHDALLAFDTSTDATLAPGGAQEGRLHELRRDCRDARWTIAFTHKLAPSQNLRTPLTLFIDDPIDACILGDVPTVEVKPEGDAATTTPSTAANLPWGNAKMLSAPKSGDGEYLLIDILEGGILPRKVQDVNETQ